MFLFLFSVLHIGGKLFWSQNGVATVDQQCKRPFPMQMSDNLFAISIHCWLFLFILILLRRFSLCLIFFFYYFLLSFYSAASVIIIRRREGALYFYLVPPNCHRPPFSDTLKPMRRFSRTSKINSTRIFLLWRCARNNTNERKKIQ